VYTCTTLYSTCTVCFLYLLVILSKVCIENKNTFISSFIMLRTKVRRYESTFESSCTFESYVYNVLYFRTIIHIDHSTRTDDTMVYVLSESVLCSDSA
jgi:hypothetical protein